MFGFGLYTKLAAAAVVATVLTAGAWKAYHTIDKGGYDRANAEWQVKIAIQKAEAILILDIERAKVAATEQKLRDFKDKQEVKDGQNKTTVAGLERRLRDAAIGGRLRDRDAAGCGSSGDSSKGAVAAGASDSPRDHPQAGRLLSESITNLLFQLALEADIINIAYSACRADALNIRQTSF